MRLKLIFAGLILAVASAPSVQAQITIDVSKVTCDQFVHGGVGNPRTMAVWFSGFYHGKRDILTYDPQVFEEDLSKLQKFCYQEKNFKMPLIQAVNEVFGANK